MRLGTRKFLCWLAFMAVVKTPLPPLRAPLLWLLPYAGEYAHWEIAHPPEVHP